LCSISTTINYLSYFMSYIFFFMENLFNINIDKTVHSYYFIFLKFYDYETIDIIRTICQTIISQLFYFYF